MAEWTARRVRTTPDYAAWIDATELDIMTGRCWSELRRPLRAVPVLERALAGYSDAHARDKALYSSWLAESFIDAGSSSTATYPLSTTFLAVTRSTHSTYVADARTNGTAVTSGFCLSCCSMRCASSSA